MKDLALYLDTSPPVPDEKPADRHIEDALGNMLQTKFETWKTVRRMIEEDWLRDLRAFNQINDDDEELISKFHSHIYLGLTRTKCLSAYSRIVDLMFQARDPHWVAEPTPVPESQKGNPGTEAYIDDMKARAEAMSTEMEDQLIDLKYEDHLKSAVLEGCIIGTGVIKGIIPGVKKLEKWGQKTDPATGTTEWDILVEEVPFPKMGGPSIFNTYPDPYATCTDDMSGCYELHIINRGQFEELKDDTRFDSDVINTLLSQNSTGNHIPLYHETERRMMAHITDATGSMSERWDLLEYWGQIPGHLLVSAGVEGVNESETYWANVWTCSGRTLLARVAPMKRQRIPYNFFIYQKTPHIFWGTSPARMMRASQSVLNGSVRSMLDGMAFAAQPMAEVNVTMLEEGQDPQNLLPGMVFLRDAGDPSVRAVNFFQPNVPTSQLMEMAEMFRRFADDETSLPAFTYGDTTTQNAQTSSGISMQLGTAALPIKAVIKNLEDYCIRPFITSLFDWNMQWSDNENIKGDMKINVLGTSALIAREVKSQALMQFLNITANPLDAQFVDRKYLLTQVAKSLEIDAKHALPDVLPAAQQPQQPQESELDKAKAALIMMQVKKEQAAIDKLVAEKANINMDTEFSAVQAAAQAITNSAVLGVADGMLGSAGFVDENGTPLATIPPGAGQVPPQAGIPTTDQATGTPQNTHPEFPPNPPVPKAGAIPQNNLPKKMTDAPSADAGIHTARNEPIKGFAEGGEVTKYADSSNTIPDSNEGDIAENSLGLTPEQISGMMHGMSLAQHLADGGLVNNLSSQFGSSPASTDTSFGVQPAPPPPLNTNPGLGDLHGRMLLNSAESQYPFLKQHNFAVSVNPGGGEGYAETYPIGEEGSPESPRPSVLPINRPGVEVYRPNDFTAHDLAAEGLHIDPFAHQTRYALQQSLSPDQISTLKSRSRDYEMSKRLGMPEDAAMRNTVDAAMRGYTTGQWPQQVNDSMKYSEQQKAMLDNLKNYMKTGRKPSSSVTQIPLSE